MSILKQAITSKAKKNSYGIKVGLLDYGWKDLLMAWAIGIPSLILGLVMLGTAKDELLKNQPLNFLNIFVLIFIAVVLLGFPYLLGRKSRRAIACKKLIKQHLELIVNTQQESIYELARSVNRKQEVVLDELKDMIELGYFNNYTLDENKLTIRRATKANESPRSENVNEEGKEINRGSDVSPKLKEFKCKMCGANNAFVIGDASIFRCEYCDYPVSV